MTYKVGFIGGGNMAGALISGIISKGLFQTDEIIASAASEKTVRALNQKYEIASTQSNVDVVQNSEIVVLAVKPYMIFKVIQEISPFLAQDQVVISIASGVTLEKLSKAMPNQKIVRAMPNTPAAVNLGMTSLCTHLGEQEPIRKSVTEIFDAIGKTAWIDESLMHAAIAVHGSSPAYAYIMIEAMADAAVLEGMPRDKAYLMAAQALLGAAQMVLTTGLHPGVLKDQVTSPGGNTIAAIAVLEQDGFRSSIIRAMKAAADKSREMESSS